jgi:hypothetical protein
MSAVAPRTLREVPFEPGEALAVLGLAHAGDGVDTDYVGYGYCAPTRVWLDDGSATRAVERPLILALHAADHAPPLADDVLLEFVLPPAGAGAAADPSVTAGLGAFLRAWLPVLPPAAPIVLAMCNPQRAQLGELVRAIAPARAWWFADGDVDSWLDDPDAPSPRLRLQARAWYHVPAAAQELP